MQRQIALAGKLPGRFEIVARQNLTIMGVFKAQQASWGKVDIVRFNLRGNFIQRQGAVGGGVYRLRLNATQHCRSARFIQIVMRALADDILFAALAVAQQADQISLGTGGQEQRGFFTGQLCGVALKFIYRRVVTIHVVSDRGGHHRLQHGGGWAGYGITA